MSKACLNCGGLIASWKRKHALFCSPKCRNSYWYQHRKESVETTPESVESSNIVTVEQVEQAGGTF